MSGHPTTRMFSLRPRGSAAVPKQETTLPVVGEKSPCRVDTPAAAAGMASAIMVRCRLIQAPKRMTARGCLPSQGRASAKLSITLLRSVTPTSWSATADSSALATRKAKSVQDSGRAMMRQ